MSTTKKLKKIYFLKIKNKILKKYIKNCILPEFGKIYVEKLKKKKREIEVPQNRQKNGKKSLASKIWIWLKKNLRF